MKRALQRILRVVAFLLLATAALGIGAYLLRGPLFGRLLAERIERELAAQLGGRFAVDRVEGSYVFDFALVGLRTLEPPPGALRRIECDRAVVEFDLMRLIDGDLGAITSVLLSGAVVEADLTRSGGASGAVELPRHLPRLELYGRAAVATEWGEVRAEGLSINTVGQERLGVRATALRLPERFGPGAPFAGTVERTGPLAFVLESETPVAGVVPARVAWDGALDARVVVGGGVAVVRIAAGEARLSAEALDLARLPAWVYPDGIEPPAEAVASVEARASSLRPLAVEIEALAPRVRWRDLDLSSARIHVRHADGATLVRTAHAEGRGFLVDAKDVAFDPALPWLVGDVGEATVRVVDLRTFVPGLDRPLSVAVTAGRKGGGGFAVSAARVEGEGILLEGTGEVLAPHDPARWREAQVSGAFTAAVRDFAALGRGFTGEVRLTGSVTGTLASPAATIAAEGGNLVVEGRAVDRATVAARVDARTVRVDELRVEAAAGTLRARGAADLGARTADGSYELDVVDLGAFLGLIPGAPAAQGAFSAKGTFAADRAGARGTAEILAHDVVAEGRGIGGVSARLAADGSAVTVEFLEAKGAWGTASGRGVVEAGERRATVEALEIAAGPVEATLGRPFPVMWTGDDARTGPLDLAALGGRVQGSVALKGRERLEAALSVEGIDLSRLDARLSGRAAGTVTVDGERYEANLTIPDAAYAGRAAEVRVHVRSGFDGIVVERLLVRAGEKFSLEGTATLPWRFDGHAFERLETVKPALAAEARLRGLSWRGAAVGNGVVTLRGDAAGLRSSVRLHDLSVDDFVVRGSTVGEIVATPARIEATGALERCDLGDAVAKASTDRGFDWTRPDDIRAALDAAKVEGEIKFRAPDLAIFRSFVPGLLELSGAADASLKLAGPVAAPSIKGQLYIAGLGARVEGDVPRLSECSADLRLEGRTVRIVACAGELGHAPVGASGSIDLDGPVLDVRLTGRNALVLADPRLRVRADFDLAVEGDPKAPRIGGTVVIADALYTRATKLVASGKRTVGDAAGRMSIRRAPLSVATLDLQVTADETIRIRSPDLRGDLSCDLRIRGTGEAPAPEGRIFFRDLLVEANQAAALKVDRGEVRFPPGEPFEPRLDVIAHTRLKGYDIDVEVLGRVDDAELRVATRPALSQDDAILLLATGYTREELQREGIPVAAVAGFIGQRLVASISGPRDPDERTFLERFNFRVGEEVSRSGEDTIEAEFEASKKLFLRVERDRFDEYNGGIVWRIRFR